VYHRKSSCYWYYLFIELVEIIEDEIYSKY
jgi:hypothetical protein